MKQIITLTISVTLGLFTACNKPATAQSESKQPTSQPTTPTASPPQPATSPAKPVVEEPASSAITAPPTVVIPVETLTGKYGWVKKWKSIECSLSRVTPNSSMARVRGENGVVFILHDMALGQLAVDGECFWDTDGVHLLKGRAYVVPGSKDGPIVAVEWE